MCGKQYDISDYMKRLYDEKQKQRQAAKSYYRNLLYNPHLPPDQGVPYDPAVMRYGAMSAYHFELYRPNWMGYVRFLVAMSPIALFYLCICHVKEKEEKLLRSGQVAYSDRKFKGIY